jgi:hypothetical protein
MKFRARLHEVSLYPMYETNVLERPIKIFELYITAAHLYMEAPCLSGCIKIPLAQFLI